MKPLFFALHAALAVGVLNAQKQKEQAPVPREADASATSTAAEPTTPGSQPLSSDVIHLPIGQRIEFALKTLVSSEHAKVGDVVELEVARPLVVDGLVIIAAGTQAQAEVVAARPRRRRGMAGTLAIAFTDVRAVSGEVVQLTGKFERSGKDNTEQVINDMAGAILLGVTMPLAPIALLQRGGQMQLEPGTELSAPVGKDLTLERSVIEKHQPVPSTELATVYVFHGWHPTCGSIELPFDDLQKGVVKLELPPGSYWFHTGAKAGVARGIFAGTTIGLTFGAAHPAIVSMKGVLRRPLIEFTSLDAKVGQTYYLIDAYNGQSAVKREFKLANAGEGEKLLADSGMPFYIVRDISPEMIDQLRAQPSGKNSKQ
jgi:hypothetical protein